MIYLLKTVYGDEETGKLVPLLKIGYADDVNRRFSFHKTSNPRAKLLDTRDGDERLERIIHQFFKDYRYIEDDYSAREWYYYDQYIINHFQDNFEDLVKIDPVQFQNALVSLRYMGLSEGQVKSLISRIRSFQEGDNIYNILGNYITEAEITDLIKEYYRQLKERKELWNLIIRNRDIEGDKIVDEFLQTRFFTTGNFDKKLEMFCEFMEEHKQDPYITSMMRYKITDLRYHNYYNFFGLARCRALKYRELNLLNELVGKTKVDVLAESIYNRFNVGEKYSLKTAKSILSEIYSGLKLTNKPKALDLKEWFEIKKVTIIDPVTKKRDNGLELLSKI